MGLPDFFKGKAGTLFPATKELQSSSCSYSIIIWLYVFGQQAVNPDLCGSVPFAAAISFSVDPSGPQPECSPGISFRRCRPPSCHPGQTAIF